MGHEAFLKQAAEAKTRIKQVSADEAETIGNQSNALVLDIREEVVGADRQEIWVLSLRLSTGT